MKLAVNFRLTVVLIFSYLVIGSQSARQQKLEDVKEERQVVLLPVLALEGLFTSIFGAAVGTAAVGAGAAALSQVIHDSHTGSSGGSSSESSSGSTSTDTIEKMTESQVLSRLQTLVASDTLTQGPGGLCVGSRLNYFGGGIHLGRCQPSCQTNETATFQVVPCSSGQCCLKDKLMGIRCTGYATGHNVTRPVGFCRLSCLSNEVEARRDIGKSCKNAPLTPKCCLQQSPSADAFVG